MIKVQTPDRSSSTLHQVTSIDGRDGNFKALAAVVFLQDACRIKVESSPAHIQG